MSFRRNLESVLDFIDERFIIHRFMSLAGLYLTYHSYMWAVGFATTTQRPGIEIAAIIAAITGPISLLQANMFKTYSNHRTESKKPEGNV